MKQLCKNKHWKLNEEYDIDKILYLLVDRPTYINKNNSLYWETKVNQWHRDYDLPAIIWNNSDVVWYINNKWCRKNNKPRRIWNDATHFND